VSWVEEDELEVVEEVVVVVVDVAEESPKKCDTPIPRKMPVVRAMMLPVVVVPVTVVDMFMDLLD
jgi:hypothetical protein